MPNNEQRIAYLKKEIDKLNIHLKQLAHKIKASAKRKYKPLVPKEHIRISVFEYRPLYKYLKNLQYLLWRYESFAELDMADSVWLGTLEQFRELFLALCKTCIIDCSMKEFQDFFKFGTAIEFKISTFETVAIFETLILNGMVTRNAVEHLVAKSKISCRYGRSRTIEILNPESYVSGTSRRAESPTISPGAEKILELYTEQFIRV